ncbi:MAG: cyclopropane-fatty-acyl-phospholipid synthase family protein [Hyphomicrobiales bacterium]
MPVNDTIPPSLPFALRMRLAPVLGGLFGDHSVLRPVLRHVFSRLCFGRLCLALPDGEMLYFTGIGRKEQQAVLRIHDWRALRRLATGGAAAFAEAYIDGEWSSPDLIGLMRVAMLNETLIRPYLAGGTLARLIARLGHLRNANTINGSQRNIARHYDLGNDFFKQWLDRGMTYSSAYYRSRTMSLEEAQRAKYDRICELASLRGGERILEVGCGWGGFAAITAGEHGCQVTGLTLSRQQLTGARRRLSAMGLDAQTDIVLRDYRHQGGSFDKIVSIEMFEAVGEAYWPAYFRMIKSCLKSGGTAVLQIITIDETRFEAYRKGADFIQRHIFPGGVLPSPKALAREARKAGLAITHREFFGQSYAITLCEWQRRFQRGWHKIAAHGYDIRLKRMWEYYFCYCETGFAMGSIDVGWFVIEHTREAET